jgi:hypothetical protein
VESVGIVPHPIGISAIPAKYQAAQFPPATAPGKPRSAIAKVKPGSHVGGQVITPVLEGLPARILIKVLGPAVDHEIVQPQLATVVPVFHHRHQSTAVKCRSVLLVSGIKVTDGRGVVDRGDHYPACIVSLGVIRYRPAVGLVGSEPCLSAAACCRIGDKRKWLGIVSPGSPAGCGVFHKCIENVPASVESKGNGVGRAPLVERVAVEEADYDMELPTGTIHGPRGG